MGDLSKNFSRWEFECHGEDCCDHSAPISERLIEGLQILRTKVGIGLDINCGFRCKKHNATIGGAAPNSKHTLGEAADIHKPSAFTPKELAAIAATIPCFRDGGIGVYDTFIHVDVRKTGKARWSG
jgi:uncharacterized protein YcbK (DUF882 family)